MQVQLFDSPYQAGTGTNAQTSRIWSSDDRLQGYVQVTGAKTAAITVSLIGE